MPNDPRGLHGANLRQRAEASLKAQPDVEELSAAAATRLLHELQVHQIELELQNEELIAARAEVEASLLRFTDLYDFAPVAYASLTPAGRITQTNLAAARLLGGIRAELTGRRIAAFIDPQDRPALEDWLSRVFEGESRQRCKLAMNPEQPGAPKRTLQIDAERASDGESARAVIVEQTEQLEATATVRALEAQVRQALKLESIGTLAGGIAHDFNNILGGLLGNLELARQDVGPDHPALNALGEIQKASERARHLVKQILTFSRKESTPAVLQALQPCVDESLDLMRSLLPAGVHMHVDMAEAPLMVLADATQLQQVVMNLCTNAWQAMEGSYGNIWVRVDEAVLGLVKPPPNRLPHGPYAHLQVRDDGCGMDEATRRRIFEPFFTTKPISIGTGLGLAVVHGIVKGHRGAVSVEDSHGVGSCFDVYLPISEAQRASADPAPGDSPPPARDAAGSPRVLYVDDDETILRMAQHLLQRRGYQVQPFLDPLEALKAVREDPSRFDIVVTDCNMARLSGLQLAEAVIALRADLPVVISSGYVTDELRKDARRIGVRFVLEKERTVEQLVDIVRRALSKGNDQQEPERVGPQRS